MNLAAMVCKQESNMQIKTGELTGAALDWAVAKCVGIPLVFKGRKWSTDGAGKRCGPFVASLCWHSYSPSTDWSQGGPIIERENIQVGPIPDIEGWYAYKVWGDMGDYTASTPLIAAMRCFVASKLGDEVDVPDDLV